MTCNTQSVYTPDSYLLKRKQMVEEQLERRGIMDKRVLDVMLSVPRHLFVASELVERAYADCPLPLIGGQTISQPYMVAKAAELLRLSGDERVLEVGSGCGYQAVVIAGLCREVIAVEWHSDLVELAERVIRSIGIVNVKLHVGDGKQGWKKEAPYHCILISCATAEVMPSWEEQLSEDGCLVFPHVRGRGQIFCRWVKGKQGWSKKEDLFEVRFVPLI